MRKFYKFLLWSICFLVLGASAQAKVVSVVPSPTTLGNEDNSTGWWGALTDDIKAEAGSTYQVAFTNYSDCEVNWHNFVLVLRKGDTSLGADGEYAVLRADHYGWGSSYNDCLHTFKDDRNWNWNWDTWLAAMNGAKCAVRIYNHGDGFATVKMIMKGTNGVTYQQVYTNIKVDANDLCFAFTVDHCHLNFTEPTNEFDSLFDTQFFDVQLDTTLDLAHIDYKITSVTDNTLEVSKGYSSLKGAFKIPSAINIEGTTYSVTSIGSRAFQQCTGLTSVAIPSSVTSIGDYAFEKCSGLTSMAVDSGNAYYDSRDNCNAIIETATNTLIAGCQNTIIPNSVTSIESEAFYNCTGLTAITIPNSVTSIGDHAFYGCSGLSSMTVDSGNTYYDSRNNCNAIIETATNRLIVGCQNTIIPNGVTTIGEDAFKDCGGLTSVIIPNSVTSIGSRAFQHCEGLTSVEIPNSVTSIGNHAFSECFGLTSVTIPNSVTSIEEGVFYYCISLTAVEIPNSVTSISDSAFSLCTGLTSVTIPNSVTFIGENAFSSCKGLTSVTIPNSVTNISYRAFFDCLGLTSVTIPNSVTTIGNLAFEGCSSLTSLTIPNSVTSIGYQAFAWCEGLTSIEIPNSVTSIGKKAFQNCTGLTKIKCLAQTPPTCGDNVFSNVPTSTCVLEVPVGTKAAYAAAAGWSEFKLIKEFETNLKYRITSEEDKTVEVIPLGEDNYYQGDIIIPSSIVLNGITYSVTSIGEKAFYDCKELTSIEIPNSVTSIGDYAFRGCTGLTSVEIPNSVTSIGKCAFAVCTGLTAVTIPNRVITIGEGAFASCPGLTSMTVDSGNAYYDSRDNCNAIIETATNTLIAGCQNTIIPNSVTSIGYAAFGRCTGLTSVTIPNSVTSIGYAAFSNCSGLTSVTIPNSVTSIGDYAFEACTGLTSVTIPNSVTSIGYAAFYNCSGLTSVTIPNSVTAIGYGAFYNCTGLTSVTIPNSVTSIGDYTFRGCTGLTSVTIPNSVTNIGGTAFYNCKGLTSIEIPNSVTSIGAGAFWFCTGLTSIEIPNSVTSIGDYVFYGCSGLTSVTIPNSVTSIGEKAFEQCEGLTSVTIPNSVTSIGESAFAYCSRLTSVTIPNSVTSIGDYAFACTGLTSVIIPNSVTAIGYGAFIYCYGLTSVTIPNSVTSIGERAFEVCEGLTSVTIPNSVTSIGNRAFGNCTGLTKIKCLAQTPPTCGDRVFYNVPTSTCVLEVPAGTKDAYAAANGWSDFTNIVEAQDIEPAEEDVTVSFGNDITEETNLSDNVVNNTYYNLNSTNGDGYDATEQGIVLNSTTSAADLEAIAGLDISDEAVSANYHGLIIQVATGSGTISVDVKTIGSHILNVKIGDGAPTQISKSERGTVDVPYNVSEPTYVYIYATSSNGASAPLHRVYRAPSANANSVILYGYGIKLDDTTAIDTLNGEQEALTDDCKIFTLGGQQVNELQPGMNIVRMKNGTVKKVFIK